ncbi:MAG: T9SS type A sorting domain-containing protein [Bacteroidetes bacterium]|nr:T9SS type A sorting domain-containing protein [Bacteroidota bacterium]
MLAINIQPSRLLSQRCLTLGLMFAMASPLSAQPVINAGNMPLLGDNVPIVICAEPPSPGPAGAAQTWDFSMLTTAANQSFEFTEAAGTPWGNQFPSSNLCGKSWDDAYSYYATSALEMNVVGQGILIGTDTAKMTYSNPETILQFPLEYGDSYLDNFSGTSQALGFSIPFTGTLDFEADGYGTLILPNGTYDNVLRYTFYREQLNTFGPGTTTLTKEQWGWMSADHRFWLLLMETSFDGFGTSNLVWYASTPLGSTTALETAGEEATSFPQLFPNPIDAGQQINIKNTTLRPGQIRLLNATGAVLLAQSATELTVSTEGLAAGLYFVAWVSPDGFTQHVQKVMVR